MRVVYQIISKNELEKIMAEKSRDEWYSALSEAMNGLAGKQGITSPTQINLAHDIRETIITAAELNLITYQQAIEAFLPSSTSTQIRDQDEAERLRKLIGSGWMSSQ